MATLVVQGTTPGAGLTMRSQQLVRDYGLDEAGWSHEIGDLQAIIRTVDERIAAGDWFVTPLWQPQYLNEVHDLRPLDDPRGVFPPPDRASLVAHRDAFDRLPERTRDVLRPDPVHRRRRQRDGLRRQPRRPRPARRGARLDGAPPRRGADLAGLRRGRDGPDRVVCRRERLRPPVTRAGGEGDRGADPPVHRRPGRFRQQGGPAHGRDFAAQAREVHRAVQAQVEAGGGTLRDVVKLTTYLTDMRYREELIPIREEFFGPKLPAHTQVAIVALGRPEWLIEVEAIAVL